MNNNIANLSLLANLQAQAGSFLSLGDRTVFGAHLRQPNPFFPAFLTSGLENQLALGTYSLTAQRNNLTVSKVESHRSLEAVAGSNISANKLIQSNSGLQKQQKKGWCSF